MIENQEPESSIHQPNHGEENVVNINNQKDEQTLINGGILNYLDILEFDTRFNDDIFRLVLSFLEVRDLGKLERVSKHLRLSQLCGEDSETWKKIYEKKVPELHEILRRAGTSFAILILPFLGKKTDFKSNIYQAIKLVDSLVEKNSLSRMEKIEKSIKNNSTTSIKDVYVPKEELLKFDISSVTHKQREDDIKLLALGDGAVGKTCLMIRLLNGEYPTEYIPTVMDNYMGNYVFEDRTYRVCYWDTATSDDYPRLRVLSYPQTDVFLAMFSITQDFSFANLFTVWIPEVRHHVPEAATVLVATKIDLRTDIDIQARLIDRYLTKPIPFHQGERAAQLSDCFTYVETSSLMNVGIKDFTEIALKAHFKNLSLKETKEKKKCLLQ